MVAYKDNGAMRPIGISKYKENAALEDMFAGIFCRLADDALLPGG
jgi:hypothetical protein